MLDCFSSFVGIGLLVVDAVILEADTGSTGLVTVTFPFQFPARFACKSGAFAALSRRHLVGR